MRSSASPLPHKKKEDIVFYVSKAPPLRALEYSVLLLSLRFFFSIITKRALSLSHAMANSCDDTRVHTLGRKKWDAQ
jgi:hypothetical protein